MGITTSTHLTKTGGLQKHLDAMVTGDITPTHAPPCRLRYSAEMQTDQQPGQRKPPVMLDEGRATARFFHYFFSRSPAHAIPPGHSTEHREWAPLRVLSSAGSRSPACRREAQGSTSPRRRRLPQQPHCTQTLEIPSETFKMALK